MHFQHIGAVKNGVLPLHRLPLQFTGLYRSCRRRLTSLASKPRNEDQNPDFDSLQLDDDYFKLIGLTREEAADQLDDVFNVDPMNDPDLNDDSDSDEEEDYSPSKSRPARFGRSPNESQLFGPPAAVLAGFRPDEMAMVRASLDEAGAYEMKVIPCTSVALHDTVEAAVQLAEPDWDKPRPSREDMGSASLGSVKTILFSGLSKEDILMCLTLLEYAGLPQVCACAATPENSSLLLGEVLTKAVKEQRLRKNSKVTEPKLVKSLDEELLSSWSKQGFKNGQHDEDSKLSNGSPSLTNVARGAFDRQRTSLELNNDSAKSNSAMRSKAPRGEVIEDEEVLEFSTQPRTAKTQAGSTPTLQRDPKLASRSSSSKEDTPGDESALINPLMQPLIETDAAGPSGRQEEGLVGDSPGLTSNGRQSTETAVQSNLQHHVPSGEELDFSQAGMPGLQSGDKAQIPQDDEESLDSRPSFGQSRLGNEVSSSLPANRSSRGVKAAPQNPGIGKSKQFLGMSLEERLRARSKGPKKSNNMKPDDANGGKDPPGGFAFGGKRTVKPKTRTSPDKSFHMGSPAETGAPSGGEPTGASSRGSAGVRPRAKSAGVSPQGEPVQRIEKWGRSFEKAKPDLSREIPPQTSQPPSMPPMSPVGLSPSIKRWSNPAKLTQARPPTPAQNGGWPSETRESSNPANEEMEHSYAGSQPPSKGSYREAEFSDSLPDSRTPWGSNLTPQSSKGAPSSFPEDSFRSNGDSNDLKGEDPREGLPDDTALFGTVIQTHEAAEEDRRLRREAADEMQRRARLASSMGNQTAYQEAVNMIDAVAAGEDLDTMLKFSGAKKEASVKDAVEQRAAENRKKMEQVLNQLRAGAVSLPEEERKKLNKQVKILEDDKDNISKVLSQLGAGLDSVPADDRAELQSQLKKEAWDPTRDAIGAALACGISGEELREMVMQAEADKKIDRGGWYPSVAQASKKDLEQFRQ